MTDLHCVCMFQCFTVSNWTTVFWEHKKQHLMEFKELKCIFQSDNITCITFIFIQLSKATYVWGRQHEQFSKMRSAVIYKRTEKRWKNSLGIFLWVFLFVCFFVHFGIQLRIHGRNLEMLLDSCKKLGCLWLSWFRIYFYFIVLYCNYFTTILSDHIFN